MRLLSFVSVIRGILVQLYWKTFRNWLATLFLEEYTSTSIGLRTCEINLCKYNRTLPSEININVSLSSLNEFKKTDSANLTYSPRVPYKIMYVNLYVNSYFTAPRDHRQSLYLHAFLKKGVSIYGQPDRQQSHRISVLILFPFKVQNP